jgi:hypothetical protein
MLISFHSILYHIIIIIIIQSHIQYTLSDGSLLKIVSMETT